MANRSDGPTNANDDCQRPADSLGAGLAGLPSQPSVIDTGLTGEDDSGHGEMAQEALTRPTCSVDPSSPSAEPVSAAFSTLSVRSSGPPTPHSKPTHSPNLSQHTTVSSLASPLPSSSSFSSLPDPHSHPTSAHSSPDRLCAAPASPPSSSTSLSTAPPPADAPPTPRQRPMMLPHKPDGSLPFRARPVPATTAEPTVSPKMSKAALLRLGLPWSPPERPVASSHSSVSDTSTRPPIAPVASLGPPSVVPRPTRASTLRTGGGVAPESAAPRLKRSESKIFENTPGHGFRRAHLQTKVASCAAPKTEPRLNKASALRTGAIVPGGESGRDSPRVSCGSGQRLSGVSFEGVPGHRRKERIEVKATNRPEIEPRMTRASLLRIGGGAAVVAGRGGGSKKTAVGGVTRAGLGGKGGGVVGVAGGGGRNDGEGYGESEIEEEEGAYEGEDRSFVEEEEAESDSGEYSVECNKINGEEGDGEGSFEEEKEGGDCELSQEQGGEGERLNGGGDHYLHQQKEVGEGFGFVTILSHKSQLEQEQRQRQQLVSGGCKN